jgi:hypothetical protein
MMDKIYLMQVHLVGTTSWVHHYFESYEQMGDIVKLRGLQSSVIKGETKVGIKQDDDYILHLPETALWTLNKESKPNWWTE